MKRWLPLLIVLAPPSLALVGVAFVSWAWLVPLVPFTAIAALGWLTGGRGEDDADLDGPLPLPRIV